uniref:Rotatin n=1 Tax=Echinostoma caproni TaxID=27848 RepID=A0A183B8B6_9TREM
LSGDPRSDTPSPNKFTVDKRFYSSLQMNRSKSSQVKEMSRDLSSPRLGALAESVVGSQLRRDSFRNRSNSCTPVGSTMDLQPALVSREHKLFSPSDRLATESALSVAEILDQMIWGLWEYDSAHGQPGHSLFTLLRSPFNYLIPYRKRNDNSEFPSYLFEDSPELFAAATYHLLSLCASSRVQVRADAIITLYLLMRNHFVLTKGSTPSAI